jgi:hypothetical protein
MKDGFRTTTTPLPQSQEAAAAANDKYSNSIMSFCSTTMISSSSDEDEEDTTMIQEQQQEKKNQDQHNRLHHQQHDQQQQEKTKAPYSIALSPPVISTTTSTTATTISNLNTTRSSSSSSSSSNNNNNNNKTDYDCCSSFSSSSSSCSPTSTAISNVKSSSSNSSSSSSKKRSKRNSRFKRLGKRKFDILYRVSFLGHNDDKQEQYEEKKEKINSRSDEYVSQDHIPDCTQSQNDTNAAIPPQQDDEEHEETTSTCCSQVDPQEKVVLQGKPGNEKEASHSLEDEEDPFLFMFVPGPISYFWQCRNCRNLPIAARAKHSVVFYAPGSSTAASSSADIGSKKASDGDSIVDGDRLSLAQRPTVQYHMRHCAAAIQRATETLGMLQQPQHHDGRQKVLENTKRVGDDDDDEEEEDYDEYKIHDPIFQKEQQQQPKGTAKYRKKQKKKSTSYDASKKGNQHPSNNHISLQEDTTSTKDQGRCCNTGAAIPKKSSILLQDTTTLQNLKASLKHVSIPPADDNKFYHPSSDCHITASIDIILVAQVERCSYEKEKDATAFLRQKPLPEGYPGMKCKHCRDKRWFFNSFKQLATGLPKIEYHLMNQCVGCHEGVKRKIVMSKKQETVERTVLRADPCAVAAGKKMTRREYAQVVFDRVMDGGIKTKP